MIDAKDAKKLSTQGQEVIDAKLVKKYLETLDSAVRSVSATGNKECSVPFAAKDEYIYTKLAAVLDGLDYGYDFVKPDYGGQHDIPAYIHITWH